MFEDQNQKTEDIFLETDKVAAETPEPTQPAPTLGPPSALGQGKLQPARASDSTVPLSQLSGSSPSGFPFKKVLAISLISLVIVGGAWGAFSWWRGRGQAVPAPVLGAPAETKSPGENQAPATDSNSAGSGNEASIGSRLNEAYSNLNQGAVDRALDPFAAPAENPANQTEPGGTGSPTDASAAIDTDQDGLSDAQEFKEGTNPRLVDSDGDGLTDWEEVSIFGANPLKTDTDGDKYPDGEEVQNGYNPNGPGKLLDFDKARENAR